MLKQYLIEAKAKLKDGLYAEALEASTKALELDGLNFQAFLCVGKSHFHLKNTTRAVEAYRRAVDIQAESPFPWKGMLEVFESTVDHSSMLEPLEKLSGILIKNSKYDRCQKIMYDLAVAATAAKSYQKALNSYFPLLVFDASRPFLHLDAHPNDELPSLVHLWLSVLQLVQMSNLIHPFTSPELVLSTFLTFVDAAFDWSSENPIRDAVCVALDSAVDFAVSKLHASMDKASERLSLDARCRDIVSRCPFAKRASEVLLLRHEDSDGVGGEMEQQKCMSILARVAPESSFFLLAQGLVLFKAQLFADATPMIRQNLYPENISGRLALAQMALLSLRPDECLEMAQSVHDAVDLRYRLWGTTPAGFSRTKVEVWKGQALVLQRKFADAVACFENILECEPMMEAAVVGLAEVHLERHELEAADHILSSYSSFKSKNDTSLLISAARGRLLHLQGKLDQAQALLEVASAQSTEADEKTYLALVQRRLAAVYWDLGGEFRSKKAYCVPLLLAAAKVNPNDAYIFAQLGQWYLNAQDIVRAEKCLLKALTLDACCALAGEALSALYTAHGETERNTRLWADMAAASVHATWAHLRLAQHYLNTADEAAISTLHTVLRQAPHHAPHWAALGHVYASFGRIMAAQKSYLKAMSLGLETNPSVLCELARIELSLGQLEEAILHLRVAINVKGSHIAIAKLLADALFQHAKSLCAEGLYGRAALHLREASALVQSNCLKKSSEKCFNKLLGDIHCFAFYLSPKDFMNSKSENDEGWIDFIAEGTIAYVKAKDPLEAKAWYDEGVGYWYEAQANSNETRKKALITKSLTALKQSLELNIEDAMSWNAFGVVQSRAVLKQLGYIRAIELENKFDYAWANLGMLYMSKGQRAIAQKAFLNLQSVNPNNPAMWTGYGLLEMQKKDFAQAHAAFTCALEICLDLDALLGFAVSGLQSYCDNDSDETSHVKLEKILFALKKYLERDPINVTALNAYGVVLMRLGLYEKASTTFEQAQALLILPCFSISINFVHCLIYKKQFDAALVVLEKCDEKEAPLLLAQIYVGLHEYPKAYDALAGITGGLDLALAKCEILYKFDQKGAQAKLQQLMQECPNNAEIASTLAVLDLDWNAYFSPSHGPRLPLAVVHPFVKYFQRHHNERDCLSVCENWVSNPQDAYWISSMVKLFFQRLDFTHAEAPSVNAALLLQHYRMTSIAGTFASWETSTACLKWLHMCPNDPSALFLVVLHLFKRYTQQPEPFLLALSKRYLDKIQLENNPFFTWQWHVLQSAYFVWSLDRTQAETHVLAAKESLTALSMPPHLRLYLEARSHVFVDLEQAFSLYLQCCRASNFNGAHSSMILHILVEIAAIVEALGCVRSALRLWKVIPSFDEKWKFMSVAKRCVLSGHIEPPKVVSKLLKELENIAKHDSSGSYEPFLVALSNCVQTSI